MKRRWCGTLVVAAAFTLAASAWGQGKDDKLLQDLDRALKSLAPPATPAPSSTPAVAPRPAAAAARPAEPGRPRVDYFTLVPGKSTRADVELLLGDPSGEQDGRLVYAPPAQASDADHVEALFARGTRTLERLDVVLKHPLPYADLVQRAGQRILAEREAGGRVWEYRVPSFLGLGYVETRDGTPPAVDRLRYASAQWVADRFVERGERAARDRRTDDALTEYEKATRIDPDYAVPYLRMGAVYQAVHDRDRALVSYTAATKALYPARARAEGHYHVGRLYYEERQDAPALAAFGRAAAEDPGYAPAVYGAGLVHHRSGRFKDAIAAYRRAIALRADFGDAYNNLGLALRSDSDLKGALGAFEKAVELAPQWDRPSHHLMETALLTSDFATVEREARRRVGVKPDDTLAMVRLAMALSSEAPERTGLFAMLSDDARINESLSWLDRAIAAGYSDRGALETSPYLRKAREQSSAAFQRVLGKMSRVSAP